MDELRKLQLCEYEILKAVTAVFENHHLNYYMVYGTLLGAVRHKGFIPWDDDVDLCMERKDLLRFVKFAKKELLSKYFVQTPKTERRGRWLFCKVRKNGTLCLQGGEKKMDAFHQGIWIDIFPIIDFSNFKGIKKIQSKIIRLLQRLKYHHFEVEKNISPKNIVKAVGEWTLDMVEVVLWHILVLLSKIQKKGKRECYIIGAGWENQENQERFTFDRDFFAGKMKKYPFEDSEFTSMENAHEFLTAFYGDYMTPKKYSHIGDYSAIVFDDEVQPDPQV